MRLPLRFPALFVLLATYTAVIPANAQSAHPTDAEARELRHQDPQWLAMKPLLPDPLTASPEKLELEADVMRARRLPEDALDYYTYALRRGGDNTRLLNKLGITELELEHVARARAYFQLAVKLHKKDAESWNNLGAIEHISQRYKEATANYNRAIRLNKKAAVYHANLGTAYFEMNDYESGGQEFQKALKLDPKVLENSGMTGGTARILREGNRGKFSFEMAKIYAGEGNEVQMLHALEVASESGFDILAEMSSSSSLAPYRKDPRVLIVVKNQQALRQHHGDSLASARSVPTLPRPIQ